jgi:hypothetical protein
MRINVVVAKKKKKKKKRRREFAGLESYVLV